MPRRSARLTQLLLATAMVTATGCGAHGALSGVAAKGVGKLRAQALHAASSRFSKHQLVAQMAPGAQPPLPGVKVKPTGVAGKQIHVLPPGVTLEAALSAYQAAPGVLSLERLEQFPVEDAPAPVEVPKAPAPFVVCDDPLYFQQWSHTIAHVPDAWSVTRGRPDVVIATLDTGADFGHPDLQGQLIDGPDFGEGKATSLDIDQHGTHIAGILVATANNGRGVAGVAPGCKALVIKIFEPGEDDDGKPAAVTNAYAMARGIQYAVTQGGAKIITISAGVPNDPVVSAMFQFARSRGVVICVSAGNKGSNHYTGDAKSQDGVLVTHATDPGDQAASFSNYGSPFAISAPGVSIISTVPTYASPITGELPSGSDPGYETMSGTSMAAPFTAGVAALATSALLDGMQQYVDSHMMQSPTLTPADVPGTVVEDLVRQTALDLGRPGRDEIFGCGRVDAGRVMAALDKEDWVLRAVKAYQQNAHR